LYNLLNNNNKTLLLWLIFYIVQLTNSNIFFPRACLIREFQFIQKLERCFDLFQKRNRFTSGQIAIIIVEERESICLIPLKSNYPQR
ncbi:MAG: hypothetical protein WBY71_05815, partial [Nitrososphaeraceae archaeon]